MQIMNESRHGGTAGIRLALILICLLAAALVAGCGQVGSNSGAAQQTTPEPTSVSTPPATDSTPTTGAEPTTEVETPTADATGTTVLPTFPPLPTPTGPPPEDPYSLIDMLEHYAASFTLVKRDILDIDGQGINDVLFTIAALQSPITEEVESRLSVLMYDPEYRTWSRVWTSEVITGTAMPLPAANRAGAGGFNGGNILGTGKAIMAARTTTRDGRAHLYIYQWNNELRGGELLKMVDDGGAEKDAIFDADLDLNMVDLDDDGIYEIIADDVSGTRIWKWDGSRFVRR